MNIINTILSKVLPHQAKAQPSNQKPSPLLSNPDPVDVEKVLTDMEQRGSQRLDWQHSIVDLMKLLGMDSSLSSRKQLAKELNYKGDMNDSASLNMWLHQQVLAKFEENGGKVPSELMN